MQKVIEPINPRPTSLAMAAAVIVLANSLAVAQTPPTPGQIVQIRQQKPQRVLVAQQALDHNRATLGLGVFDSFEPKASTLDERGRLHVRFQRYYQTIRVIGGDVKVAVDAGGVSGSVTNFTRRDVAPVSVVPTVREVAVQEVIAGNLGLTVPEIKYEFELVILPAETRQPARLAWLVTADAPRIAATRYYIDAANGQIIRKEAAYVNADNDAAPGGGHSFHSGQVGLTTRFLGGKYKLEDTTRGGTLVYDMEDRKPTEAFHGSHYWHANNTWGNGQDWTLGDPTNGPTGQTAAVDAMYGARLTWDVLKNVFGREGLDDNGSPMKLRVHYREKSDELFNNGRWDGTFANFGDGGPGGADNWAKVLIVAHELGHGLWHSAVSSDNSGEAKGLNEGHGDIMGAVVRHYQVLANGQGSVIPTNTHGNLVHFWKRSVNPHHGLPNYVYPDDPGEPMGSLEEHDQGSVYGKVFSRLAMGAPSQAEAMAGPACPVSGDVTPTFTCLASQYLPQGMAGIGMQKAALIWYKATTEEFDANPTFHEAVTHWLTAAGKEYSVNSSEYKSVMNAFAAVGIGQQATDTEKPTVSLGPPVVDDFEQSVKVAATALDDIGVHRLDFAVGQSKTTIPGGKFNGYLDLTSVPFGSRSVTVTAFDSLGNEGQASRSIVYKGGNFVIQNRGFEADTNWVSSGGVVKSDAAGAFLGSRYASLAGFDWTRQQFNAPETSPKCTVGYRVRVNPKPGYSATLLVELLESDGSTLKTLLNTIPANLDTTDATSNHYKRFLHEVNGCGGSRDLWIRFRSLTPLPGSDTFRVDNAYVVHHAPPSADFTVAVDPAEGSVIFAVKNIQNIDSTMIKHVELASPGGESTIVKYAPYVKIRPTGEFTPNVEYTVSASLIDYGDTKVFTSPAKKFKVTPVNQLFGNPGFENSLVSWLQVGETGHCHFNPAAGEGPAAFLGTGCVWMTGNGSVSQDISIPKGPGQAGLTFRLKIKDGVKADKLRVVVVDTNSGVVTQLDEIEGDTNTLVGDSHMNYLRFKYDLSAFAGQTVRIRFESIKGAATRMLFFLDNVGATHKGLGLAL